MAKQITKKIEKLELIKIEKVFNNPSKKQIYHYNLFLEDIDEPLILSELNNPINIDVVGKKIKYKLSDENEITDFEIL
jgi:hypothetical protein